MSLVVAARLVASACLVASLIFNYMFFVELSSRSAGLVVLACLVVSACLVASIIFNFAFFEITLHLVFFRRKTILNGI